VPSYDIPGRSDEGNGGISACHEAPGGVQTAGGERVAH
jgi:hypothetical protein